MTRGRTKVAVAMSGGVDSTLAAALLIEAGYECMGIWMRCDATGPSEDNRSYHDALSAAGILAIPLTSIDLQQQFETHVISYFVREYHAGRTPNPCVVCNSSIKFGALWAAARHAGYEYFATGHYARVRWDARRHRFGLLRGIDRHKDQSYFLWKLTQDQLSRVLLPIGGLTKAQVRTMAREKGLPVSEQRESQEICFIPHGDYREYLSRRQQKTHTPRGEIIDTRGRIVGRHHGIDRFTIGQRRGIGIPSHRPYYVVDLDPLSHRVVVGHKEDLLTRRVTAEDTHWVSTGPPEAPIRALGQIRYRHHEAPCVVSPYDDGTVEVTFDTPQESVTPGQSVVWYHDDLLLGGGWIERGRRA